MGYPRRMQNSINGPVRRSMSGAYSGHYRYGSCKNDETHTTEEMLNSSEEKTGMINPDNLLNNTKGSKAKIISREEIEKDKTSAASMVGESAFFKEVEGGLKIEVSSKTLTPGA
ncbi:hypothetical protein [Rickettsiella endosymbiont of Dermanyssus gallinae]|uniref:hypothetical protein n=1 Tax=Rickettsiella endosymbiont of Dermanyssus gallinae TaxID=2856608 RepID=UPI001C52F74D|nr:hypothetical protein [Rickettsiella endosymbiont of Dermanyssus gallinae]